MHYLRKTSAPGEVFVAGEGAGYLNPTLLQEPRPEPGLPDALALWVAHNTKWYRQWDISVTGFNIDSNTARMNERGFAAYQKFSPGGIGLQGAPSAFGVQNNLPYLQMMTDLSSNDGRPLDDQTVDAVRSFFEPDAPGFVLVRSILQSPSYYAELQKRLQQPGSLPCKLVDLPTLLWLVREFQSDPRSKKYTDSFACQLSVRATPEAANGVWRRTVADGISTIERFSERLAWRIPGGKSPYLYFDVANDFIQAGSAVRICLSYPASEPHPPELHYDSSDAAAPLAGAYKSVTPAVTSLADGLATAEFILPDALFAGRQNGGCDFRLYAGQNPMIILAVEISRVP